MDGVQVSERLGVRKGDGVWLGLAVLVHALVLLIPVAERLSSEAGSLTVSVSLFRPIDQEKVAAPEQPSPPEPVQITAQKREIPPILPSPEQPAASDGPPAPDAAQLIESVKRLQLTDPSKKTRQLGEFEPPPLPRNWLPRITTEDNMFDGKMLPPETEIVDRWLAADGSHNVVINTPGGHTLCGRAEAWDPMRPLVEPVMMFRPCGGGGKRTFKMPDRYLKKNRHQ